MADLPHRVVPDTQSTLNFENIGRELTKFDYRTGISVKEYGAIGDGKTDDTAAIQRALTDLSLYGESQVCGDLIFPVGRYLITDVIEVPPHVNVVGSGGNSSHTLVGRGTAFVAGHADAQLKFDYSVASLGGFSGNFAMDGNLTSNRSDGFLYIGDATDRAFGNIDIARCEGDGMHVHYGQNMMFYNFYLNKIAGTGLTLDEGTGGNLFQRIEIASCGEFHLKIQESVGTGPYTSPQHNRFDHCIFERNYEYPGGSGSIDGGALIEAGLHNYFYTCAFVAGSTCSITGNDAVLQVTPGVVDAGNTASSIYLADCQIFHANQGPGEWAIRQESGGQVHVTGDLWFNVVGNAWQYNGGTGTRLGRIDWGSGVTTRIGGSGTVFDNNVGARVSGPLRLEADTTKDGVLSRFSRSGETYPRLTVSNSGSLQWSNGSSGQDTEVRRVAANQAGTGADDAWYVSTYEDFPEQGSDPAAPGTNTARVYARDNGAGKTQLCVRFNSGAVQVLATEP